MVTQLYMKLHDCISLLDKVLKEKAIIEFLSLIPEGNSLHNFFKFPSKPEGYKGAQNAYVVVMLALCVSIHHQMLSLATGDKVFMVVI